MKRALWFIAFAASIPLMITFTFMGWFSVPVVPVVVEATPMVERVTQQWTSTDGKCHAVVTFRYVPEQKEP